MHEDRPSNSKNCSSRKDASQQVYKARAGAVGAFAALSDHALLVFCFREMRLAPVMDSMKRAALLSARSRLAAVRLRAPPFNTLRLSSSGA